MKKNHYRTIFISDIHLGTRGCSARKLLQFLETFSCDKLYLVGDIIDFWAMSRGKPYLPKSHRAVVHKIMQIAASGTKVIYLPGNHDQNLRVLLPMNVGGIEIINEDIHVTADGRQLLILHGDAYDQVHLHAEWMSHWGDHIYDWAMRLNYIIGATCELFGRKPWSLSKWLKRKVKQAISFIGSYEKAVSDAVSARGLDGVVCGHIHYCEIKTIGGILYANSGDWVESCTALFEDHTGLLTAYEAP